MEAERAYNTEKRQDDRRLLRNPRLFRRSPGYNSRLFQVRRGGLNLFFWSLSPMQLSPPHPCFPRMDFRTGYTIFSYISIFRYISIINRLVIENVPCQSQSWGYNHRAKSVLMPPHLWIHDLLFPISCKDGMQFWVPFLICDNLDPLCFPKVMCERLG